MENDKKIRSASILNGYLDKNHPQLKFESNGKSGSGIINKFTRDKVDIGKLSDTTFGDIVSVVSDLTLTKEALLLASQKLSYKIEENKKDMREVLDTDDYPIHFMDNARTLANDHYRFKSIKEFLSKNEVQNVKKVKI
jgi:hypothetical protein